MSSDKTPPDLMVKPNLKSANNSSNCAYCTKPIQDEYIEAMEKWWHPSHFVCHHCSQNLSNKKAVERSGSVYCVDDYHELFSPRCACCNDPIKDGGITAMGKTWHKCHFMCAHCGDELNKEGGFYQQNGEPYCERDFHNIFLPRCACCHDPIQQSYVAVMGKKWHPEHFTCHHCGKILDKLGFHTENDKPYCSADCHSLSK